MELPTDIHNIMWNNESEKAIYIAISALRPRIFPDGDRWCVLYGENISEGICGFGKTPIAAIRDFNNNVYNQTLNPQTPTP
jgi:hypothetical protein